MKNFFKQSLIDALLLPLLPGRIDINKTEKHACLALGTLIKAFLNSSSHSEKANKVLTSLQEWLGLHNQSIKLRYNVFCHKSLFSFLNDTLYK